MKIKLFRCVIGLLKYKARDMSTEGVAVEFYPLAMKGTQLK